MRTLDTELFQEKKGEIQFLNNLDFLTDLILKLQGRKQTLWTYWGLSQNVGYYAICNEGK